jgi:hypothetical protein
MQAGFGPGILGPAVAAISLGLVGHTEVSPKQLRERQSISIYDRVPKITTAKPEHFQLWVRSRTSSRRMQWRAQYQAQH